MERTKNIDAHSQFAQTCSVTKSMPSIDVSYPTSTYIHTYIHTYAYTYIHYAKIVQELSLG